MPACLRSCLFINVSERITLDIKPRFPLIILEAKLIIPDMNMSIFLPTGAIIAAPTNDPATISRAGARVFAIPVSTLRLAGYCQQLLSSALLSLLIQVSLWASILLGLGQSTFMKIFRATKTTAYRSGRLSRKAAWALWDSARMRQLRKKIEFEFFTLILGAGGSNLCLVIFWPGWGILGLAAFILSAWCVG
ncbi:hypothetical protein GGR58DRAFT_518855 [Xylaria digitata]|nr:hypothetical protein GGR58DRAFT_518855 [Xylaria digitata]